MTDNVFPQTGDQPTWADIPANIFDLLSKEFERRAADALGLAQIYAEDGATLSAQFHEGVYSTYVNVSLMMDAAPKPTGFDVWMKPTDGDWHKVAWFDARPSLTMLDQYNAERYSGLSFIRERDNDDYIASTGGQEVRRYRVVNAGEAVS